ncbi:MAG: hypothetical protein H7Y33_17970 [Cytophagales bacterium]|nr:hypothetical protein [Rhizobacter sp.]
MTAPKGFSFATMMVLAQRRHAARMAAQEATAPQQRREMALRSPLPDWVNILQRFALPKGKHV